MVHVHADANNGEMRRMRLRAHFDENARDFFAGHNNIIRRLNYRFASALGFDCGCHHFRCPLSQSRRIAYRNVRPEQNGEPESFVRR